MSLPFPTATLSSLPLSVHLLAQHGGSAAMVAAAVWRWQWQIGSSVAGREAAAQWRRQLSFSLAAAVEVLRRRRWWRQWGGGGSSASAVALASTMSTVSAARCWQQQCSCQRQRGSGTATVGSRAMVSAVRGRRRQHGGGSGNSGNSSMAAGSGAAGWRRWQRNSCI
jgi:hypothetical protein